MTAIATRGLVSLPTGMPDVRPRLTSTKRTFANGWTSQTWVGRVPLTHLVTNHTGMVETYHSGRVSDTPYLDVELCLREDHPGLYEIVDGHHRLAAHIRRHGITTPVQVIIRDYCDDEPYEGPYFDFTSTAALAAPGA